MTTPPISLGINDPSVITGFTPTYGNVVGEQGPRGIDGEPGTGLGIVLPDDLISYLESGASPGTTFRYEDDTGLIYDQDGNIYGNGWALVAANGTGGGYPFVLPSTNVVGPLYFRRVGKLLEFRGGVELFDQLWVNDDAEPFFTLPANFRPLTEAYLAGFLQSPGADPSLAESSTNLAPHPCYVKIKTNGQITVHTDADANSPPVLSGGVGSSRLVQGFDGWVVAVA